MDLSLQSAAERIEERLEAIERRLAAIEALARANATETPEPAPRRSRK